MIYIVLALIYLLILNVIATIRLLKSELNENPQKLFQTILIWLLPLLGAVVISMLLNQDESIDLKKKNIIKSILLFIFIIKINNDRQKKKYKGYGDFESSDDILNAHFQASASDL